MFHEDYLQRCRDNVRAEMYWVLDEKTRLTGCQLVRDQVYRTIEEVGIDTYKGFIREAVEEGRRTLIGRVKQLAFPGEYEAPTFIDLPWAKDETVHQPLRRGSPEPHRSHSAAAAEGRSEADTPIRAARPSPYSGSAL